MREVDPERLRSPGTLPKPKSAGTPNPKTLSQNLREPRYMKVGLSAREALSSLQDSHLELGDLWSR